MMKRAALLLLLLLFASCAGAQSVRVGGQRVVYDEVIRGDSDYDGVDDRTSYYLEDVLVFSAYDTDGDGEQDMWFTYVEGTYPKTAMRDTTGDGRPENIVTLDKTGAIVKEADGRSGRTTVIIVATLLVLVLVALLFLRRKKRPVRKKPEAKKQKEKVSAKVGRHATKAKEHVKKAAKNVGKHSRNAYDATKKHSKNAYSKAEPHVRKAAKKVKEGARKTARKTKEFYRDHQAKRSKSKGKK